MPVGRLLRSEISACLDGVRSSSPETQPDSINHVLNLPLNNQFASFTPDGDASPPVRLTACGIKLVRHLLDLNTGRWIDPRTFQASFQRFRPPSLRLLQSDLRRQHLTLTQNFPLLLYDEGCRLSSSQLQNISFRPDSPVIFKLPLTENGLSAPSKNLYVIFNKVINRTKILTK